MRPAIVVLAILTLPALALAQRSAPAPSAGLPPIGFPLPPIGFPLPPIGLPLAPIGLPVPPATVSSSPLTPKTAFDWQRERGAPPPHSRADKSWRDEPRRPLGHSVVYFGSPYYWSSPMYSEAAPAPAVNPLPDPSLESGTLRLEIEPPDLLQLFVDAVYVGTIEDTSGELALHPGTRRIEIRKPGYESLTFDARIVAGRAITYRGALTRAPEAVAAPREDAKPKPSQTFYLIPGCYMGNIPPEQVHMAPGCERRRVITYTP